VEFALILPLFLLLLVGLIEFGRAVGISHTLSEVARSGARLYSLRNVVKEQDVYLAIDKNMKAAGLTNYEVKLDPDPSQSIAHLSPVAVEISLPFDSANWGASWFLKGTRLKGRCVMPADLEASTSDASARHGTGVNIGSDTVGDGTGS